MFPLFILYSDKKAIRPVLVFEHTYSKKKHRPQVHKFFCGLCVADSHIQVVSHHHGFVLVCFELLINLRVEEMKDNSRDASGCSFSFLYYFFKP